MLIDWFTVAAQALNFLVLVWLMKRFLYRPILNAIDAREKLIAGQLATATASVADANKERDDFRRKNEAFDQQRAALLTTATDEARATGARLMDDARTAATAADTLQQSARRDEARTFAQTITRHTQDSVFAITRKVLADVASASLEEQASAVFVQRLRALDAPAKTDLTTALKSASTPALVRSAFELPPAQRTAIQDALNQTCSATIAVRYETAPDLVSGIELQSNGRQLAWNISDYLTSMEHGLDDLLTAPDTHP
jgi:F-type H+-transporting ATPase subunit b